MITARDFSARRSGGIRFGLSVADAAAALRALAQDVEDGLFLIHGVESKETAGVDKWTGTELIIHGHYRHTPEVQVELTSTPAP